MANNRQRWKPALLALLIQPCALALVILPWALAAAGRTVFDWYILATAQGIVAMAIAVVLRMDAWWRLILLIFPVSLLLMLQLALPSWVYLTGFVLTLGLFWTTFRTQVPFYPSHPAVWKRVAAYLPTATSPGLVDVGSGLGGLVMYLARVRPHGCFVGVELAPLPWLFSYCRARLGGVHNAEFILKSYAALDFARFDVVFAYLSPVAMADLWRQAKAQMRPGSVLLSYAFIVPGEQPDEILYVENNRPPIYLWRF